MNTNARHHLLVAAGISLVVIAVGVPSIAVASTPPIEDNSGITVVDEGASDHRVPLKGPLSAGATADVTVTYEADLTMSGPRPVDYAATGEITRTTEVFFADPDGSYRSNDMVTAAELDVTVPGGSETELAEMGVGAVVDFSPLIGLPLEAYHSTSRTIGGLYVATAAIEDVTAEQRDLIDLLAEVPGLDGLGAPFPTTPVGEGAVWTAEVGDSVGGLPLPYTVRYTLIDLEGTQYSVEASIEGDPFGPIDTHDSGTPVSGDVSFTGTLTGDAANGLDRATSLDMTFAATITEGGVASALKAAVVIDYVSTPR
jgi:hypothetical protein